MVKIMVGIRMKDDGDDPECDGWRSQRRRIDHLLGGLAGLNTLESPREGEDTYAYAHRMEHRLTNGETLDGATLSEMEAVFRSMKASAMERSVAQWWRDQADIPNNQAYDLAAMFLQNASRIDEVLGMMVDARQMLTEAEEKLLQTVGSNLS